jgi:phosphohistidine phosphatase
MKTLYLLRHAKSSWDDPTLPDRERPLAPRGRRDARRIAAYIARERIEPELVLCSTAVRTRQTLELIQLPAPVALEEELYAASARELLERVRRLPDGVASVLLIGHNPGLHELARTLVASGADRQRLEAKFPTAALATLVIADASWKRLAPGDAVLTAYIAPKQLR